jgi:chromosome segregation ATPase
MPNMDVEIASPFEEKVIEYGLAAVNQEIGKSASDRANLAKTIKSTNKQTSNATSRLSKSAEQLWSLYAKYNLDTKTARALNNSIHHDQSLLTRLSYKRQQAIHQYLTQDQFSQFLHGIQRAYKEHASELYGGSGQGGR